MSLPIYVDAYSGHKADERPGCFDLDGEVYDIVTVVDRWYEPNAKYFRVRTLEGKQFILRYAEHAGRAVDAAERILMGMTCCSVGAISRVRGE